MLYLWTCGKCLCLCLWLLVMAGNSMHVKMCILWTVMLPLWPLYRYSLLLLLKLCKTWGPLSIYIHAAPSVQWQRECDWIALCQCLMFLITCLLLVAYVPEISAPKELARKSAFRDAKWYVYQEFFSKSGQANQRQPSSRRLPVYTGNLFHNAFCNVFVMFLYTGRPRGKWSFLASALHCGEW